AEREAARRFIELHRGDAEIERYAIGGIDAALLHKTIHLAEATLDELKAAFVAPDQRVGAGDDVGIAVDTPDPAADGIEKALRVTAGPERAVYIYSTILGLKDVEYLGEQDRSVSGRELVHRSHSVSAFNTRRSASARTPALDRNSSAADGSQIEKLLPPPTKATASVILA